jgi:RNA polymerase sigma-70 factor (ECF subfamily)
MRRSDRNRIRPYLDRLYAYAFSLCVNGDEAKDLIQDCAVKALTAKRWPDDEAAYRAWLFKILRNCFFDRLRRGETAAAWVVQNKPLAANPEMEYWTADERLINAMTVKQGMARLSAQQREIIVLIDVNGFSYAEVAELLEVPVGTVMSRISRARQALIAEVSESNLRGLPVRRRQ